MFIDIIPRILFGVFWYCVCSKIELFITFLKEAFRYNLLHVCGKENRPQICEYILNLLNSARFIQKLYRNDTAEQTKARSNHLLDLYLNTPEKGVEF